jgi:hypothetical protein
MKLVLLSLLVLLSWQAHAQTDLETDDSFFHSAKSPYEDDELDRSIRKDPVVVGVKQQNKADTAVKSEFSSVRPGLLRPSEAAAMDQAVVRENKRREKAILKRLAENGPMVKACVDQSKQKLQNSQITIAWLISPTGKVLQAAVKSSDVQNPEIEKCIYEASSKLTFDEAASEHLKQSLAEYTYKFKVAGRSPASMKSKARKIKKVSALQR